MKTTKARERERAAAVACTELFGLLSSLAFCFARSIAGQTSSSKTASTCGPANISRALFFPYSSRNATNAQAVPTKV